MPLGVGIAGDGQSPGAGGVNPDTARLAGSTYDETVTHAFGTAYTAGANRRMVVVAADCNPGAYIGWTNFTSGGNTFTPGGYAAGNAAASTGSATCTMTIIVDPGASYKAKSTGVVNLRAWVEIDF